VPKDKLADLNKTNCWICEGWAPHKFEFTPGISTDIPIDITKELTLRAEFDEYHPDALDPDDENSGSLCLYRMIPPRKCMYYFMTESNIILLTNDQDQEDCKLIDDDK
jgi:hypothetical protein